MIIIYLINGEKTALKPTMGANIKERDYHGKQQN